MNSVVIYSAICVGFESPIPSSEGIVYLPFLAGYNFFSTHGIYVVHSTNEVGFYGSAAGF